MLALKIAWRYLFSRKSDKFARLVTLLAIVGITIGVMALVVIFSITNGLSSYQQRSILSTLPHVLIYPKQQNYISKDYNLALDPKQVIKKVEINSSEVIIQSEQAISSANLIGIAKFSDTEIFQNYPENIYKQMFNQRWQLIFPAILANQMHVSIGDKVKIIVAQNSQLTAVGFMPISKEFTVKQIYYGGSEIYANINDVGALLHLRPNQYQGLRLFLADPFNLDNLEQSIDPNKWQIKDWRSQKGEFFQAIKMEQNMLTLLILLIIIVAVVNVITSISLLISDKQREVAVLSTIGLSSNNILKIFMYQGVISAFIGSILGAILGVLLSYNINGLAQVLSLNLSFPVEIRWLQILTVVVLTQVLVWLAVLYPAKQSLKLEPAKILAKE